MRHRHILAAAVTLVDPFDGAAGGFILATPTDAAGTNETGGVWFLDPPSGTPAQSLGWSARGRAEDS